MDQGNATDVLRSGAKREMQKELGLRLDPSIAVYPQAIGPDPYVVMDFNGFQGRGSHCKSRWKDPNISS